MSATELLLDRFVWQRDPNDAEHPYKWDVILTETPTDPALSHLKPTVHDAMSPAMAEEQFGFTKGDVSKVVNPFLILEAGRLRAQLAEQAEAAAKAAGEAKVTIAAQQDALRKADEDSRALAAEAEAKIAELRAQLAAVAPQG